MTQQDYIRAVREIYTQMPNTSGRFSRSDRELAHALYQRGIPIPILRSALLLGTARRVCRIPAGAPLPPVRSLHYFLPVLDEILLQPLTNGYLQYLESKIAQQNR
jgi:hypothetical protein